MTEYKYDKNPQWLFNIDDVEYEEYAFKAYLQKISNQIIEKNKFIPQYTNLCLIVLKYTQLIKPDSSLNDLPTVNKNLTVEEIEKLGLFLAATMHFLYETYLRCDKHMDLVEQQIFFNEMNENENNTSGHLFFTFKKYLYQLKFEKINMLFGGDKKETFMFRGKHTRHVIDYENPIEQIKSLHKEDERCILADVSMIHNKIELKNLIYILKTSFCRNFDKAF